jgi:hypothetical protein
MNAQVSLNKGIETLNQHDLTLIIDCDTSEVLQQLKEYEEKEELLKYVLLFPMQINKELLLP